MNGSGFTFRRQVSEDRLPYGDGEMDIVFCLMCFHHVRHPQIIMKEIMRLLRPGGLLVIREHHCDSPLFGQLLDVMHGLYALVENSVPEDPLFLSTYAAWYRSKEEWTRQFHENGFEHMLDSPGRTHG